MLRVQVDIVQWNEAVVACGMLQPADYDNRAAIEAANCARARAATRVGLAQRAGPDQGGVRNSLMSAHRSEPVIAVAVR